MKQLPAKKRAFIYYKLAKLYAEGANENDYVCHNLHALGGGDSSKAYHVRMHEMEKVFPEFMHFKPTYMEKEESVRQWDAWWEPCDRNARVMVLLLSYHIAKSFIKQ